MRSNALSFVERHGLWSDEQKEAASRLRRIVEEQKLEVIRLSFPDQHGILRGKTLVASEALASLESGCSITTTMLAKDTSHRTVFPVFTSGGGFGMREMEGAADVLMVADPTTFRVLPWAPETGWLLCDIYFADGRPVPFSTRQLYRSALDRNSARAATISSPASRSNSTSSSSTTQKCRRRMPASRGRRRRSACCRMAINISPSSATTRWSRCWKSSGATCWRSACPCARSKSSSARASANSPSSRRRASRPPTTWCCSAAP